MSKIPALPPCWNTSSFGHSADISPLERSDLGEHLSHCGALRGPVHKLLNMGSGLHGLVAGRAVTSTLVVLLLVGGAWLMY